ncbi:trypsin-like peptidase domain-containing protein [Phormidium tenue]|uniref:Serine protease n=1 Tax=Phormidium tenue FACHB-1050 TaxID=2692857 RepID=A0ABR8CIQ3_9CYAN|nr:trypsin-like peptidase domain-containing protein [Phormidium tenue]MBD2319469.1 trypsin-like peptidase domain-containing protein [Phormidium tenue FACHB-1050]
MELSGDQFKKLRIALQSAYPKKAKLEILLREEMNVRLDDVVGGSNLTETVAELVSWAESKGKIPDLVSAAIKGNSGNPSLLNFVASFGMIPVESKSNPVIPSRLNFEWLGPTEDLELQSFWRSKPEIWDMAFLKYGVDRAASVCRIEIENRKAIGTGVLVKQDLLLTNYHVYEDAGLNASRLRLVFGALTGIEKHEQIFQLADDPIVGFSYTDELDYVLLRVESRILQATTIRPVSYDTDSPPKGGSIHIVQHPDGESMKVAFGTNGVTGVYKEKGLIQYISKTSNGSSGSPCFNDQWQLVALHHAERATTFGIVCEGILFSKIYPQIASKLV